MTIECSEHGAGQLSDCPACRALVEYEAAKRRLREVGRLVIVLTELGRVIPLVLAESSGKLLESERWQSRW